MSRDTHRQGCSNLKTAIKHNLGTKSEPMRSGYLEMFIIDKHRSKLLQERANLTKRTNQINAEIVRIDKDLSKKISAADHYIRGISNKDVKEDKVINSMKRMTLNY